MSSLADRLADIDREALTRLRASLNGHSPTPPERIIADRLAALRRMADADSDAPVQQAEPVTRPGDLWLLGKHRLLCGDSTDRTSVVRLLAGAKPGIMVTDPPYGVDYDPNWRNEANRWSGSDVKLGASALGVVHNDHRVDWSAAFDLFPGAVAYVWHAALHTHTARQMIEACGFDVRTNIIWTKSVFVIGRGDYHWQHEPCWYAVRTGQPGGWVGGRDQGTIWRIDKNRTSETGHSTQKPVECMERPLRNHSAPEVYDPFVGSGTTIIAAERTGRTCYAMELDPRYVDVAVRRWEAFTGRTAERVG